MHTRRKAFNSDLCRVPRHHDTGLHSDMQESRMSSSRIREDNYPMILEAKIQKQNQLEHDLD